MSEDKPPAYSDVTAHGRGLRDRTRLGDARNTVFDVVAPITRTTSVPVSAASGRVLGESVTAARPVPHHDRVATDGYAVVAQATFGATARSPVTLSLVSQDGIALEPTDEAGGARSAVPVCVGSELPDGADAVVHRRDAERIGDDLEVRTTVTPGEHVDSAGSAVRAGTELFAAGDRVQPAGVGLLCEVGRSTVAVYERATVRVVPTGDDVVTDDVTIVEDEDHALAPGDSVATNGPVLSNYVESWGGEPVVRDVVPAAADAVAVAVERDAATADLVVTTGGTGAGTNDHVPDAVADVGRVHHHGLATRPGSTAGVGVVDDTPILMLPGDPVSCIVTAHALLRPALARAAHLPASTPPTTPATLARKVASEPGVREFVPVRLDDPDGGDDDSGDDSDDDHAPAAVPLGTSGLSNVATADGWVTIPESLEGVDAGATVDVADWEVTR